LVLAIFAVVELEMEERLAVAFVEAVLGKATSALVSFVVDDHQIESRVAGTFAVADPGIEA
jgi:hypothetical protein